MPEIDRTEGRTDAPFTEAATGAESTYVHGGQRPLENPPRSGAADASMPVQDKLNDLHVDSKLSANEPAGQMVKGAKTDAPDEFGRTPEQMKELQTKREKAFQSQDDAIEARKAHAAAVNDGHNAIRDRTLAVQEEIATRERDGAMPGTPAFERRKQRIREIVGHTTDTDDQGNADGDHADRLQVIAASLHTRTPGGIEDAQRELMALAAEMRGDGTIKKVA